MTERAYIILCHRAHAAYAMGAFTGNQARERADVYCGWMNRIAISAVYLVVETELNPLTPAMRAEAARAARARWPEPLA